MAHSTYLPAAYKEQGVTGEGGAPMNECAAHFAEVWLRLLGERGKRMVCDSRLVAASQRQADWLQAHDFNKDDPHLGEGNSTANERARAEGYELPSYYPTRGNQIESATRSWDVDMNEIVSGLMNHSTHYAHMHVQDWYEHHTVFGVGCAGTYFVVVSAPPEP